MGHVVRAVATLVVVGVVLGGGAWGQDEPVFADGFESGDTCAWSPGGCVTLRLPGGVPMTLMRVPAGTFEMGSPADERGRWVDEDLHQVTLTQDYYLGRFEVTQAQWEAVMGTTPWVDCGSYGVGPTHPAYCVSWVMITGADGFVEQLKAYLAATGQPAELRLPTEAEWERAARAGTQTRFSHGDVLECGDSCEACSAHDQSMWWCGSQPFSTSQPVGSRLANALGLYDMHGNMFEWVQDWWEQHLGNLPVTDPTGPPTGSYRVIRSGSWHDYAGYCRSAGRSVFEPGSGHHIIGFRLAGTAP